MNVKGWFRELLSLGLSNPPKTEKPGPGVSIPKYKAYRIYKGGFFAPGYVSAQTVEFETSMDIRQDAEDAAKILLNSSPLVRHVYVTCGESIVWELKKNDTPPPEVLPKPAKAANTIGRNDNA